MNAFDAKAVAIESSSDYLASCIRTDRKLLRVEYYSYNLQALNLAVGEKRATFLQMKSDSDFVFSYMSGIAKNHDAVSAAVTPNALVQITDTTNSKDFFSQETQFLIAFGMGGIPFLVPVPTLLAANVNLQFTFTNNFTGPLDLDIVLTGKRLFYAGTP